MPFFMVSKRNQSRYRSKPCFGRIYRLLRIVETRSLHLTTRPVPCAPETSNISQVKVPLRCLFKVSAVARQPSVMMGLSNRDQRRPDLSVLHVFRHRLPRSNIFRANAGLGCHLQPNGTGQHAICRRQQARN